MVDRADARVAFLLQRFHPNLAPLMRELTAAGAAVTVFAEYSGVAEDHAQVKPTIVGRRRLPGPFRHSRRVSKNLGLYPTQTLRSILASDPTVVVIRDFSVASLALSLRLRWAGVRVVMYSQIGYGSPSYRLRHAFFMRLFARDLVTPVRPRRGLAGPDPNRFGRLGPRWHYAPFVAVPRQPVTGAPDVSSPFRRPVTILTVSKLQRRKRVLEWLRLFEQLERDYPWVRLMLVGPKHEDEYAARTLEAIERTRGVTYLGTVPHAEMPGVYAQADLFVLPSVQEAAAVSHLEAMAHGLPVIVSDDNGTAGYVQDGVNGRVFASGSWESDLERVMREVLDEPDRLREMGDESRRIVREQHGVDRWLPVLTGGRP